MNLKYKIQEFGFSSFLNYKRMNFGSCTINFYLSIDFVDTWYSLQNKFQPETDILLGHAFNLKVSYF